jgi:hypothetical protein
MRYQNFVLRFMEPADLFKNLVVAFISANSSTLMAGEAAHEKRNKRHRTTFLSR